MSDSGLMKELELLLNANPQALRELSKPEKPRSEAKVSYDLKPLPDTFKVIKIGSSEWIEYWKEYPDQQKDMLKWKIFVAECVKEAFEKQGLTEGELK